MKFNKNCAREILKQIEQVTFGKTLSVLELQNKMSEYSLEDVLFIVSEFHKSRLLTILGKALYDDNDVLGDNQIKSLTDKGYVVLDSIRSGCLE